jgi:hypothetical protein
MTTGRVHGQDVLIRFIRAERAVAIVERAGETAIAELP